ncbi:MAG: hypothetical protein Q9210_002053 [Variospora velana]
MSKDIVRSESEAEVAAVIDRLKEDTIDAETNHLLRHDFREGDDFAVHDLDVAAGLGGIRNDFQKVDAEWSSQSPSLADVVMKLAKGLGLLEWDPFLIAEAIATLNGTATYTTTVPGGHPRTCHLSWPRRG